MARNVLKDMCRSVSTTTGTGTFTLAGAFTGFRSIESVLSNGDTIYYTIFAVDAVGNPTGAWETGHGTYTTSGTTLARNKVTASSNSGSAVNFAAGTKHVIISATQDVLTAPIMQPGCRLSLVSSGLSDTNSSGTVYLLPWTSAFIPLYNGYCWTSRLLPNAGVSLALTKTVFANRSGVTTNGSPTMTGISSTTGFYPGMLVDAAGVAIKTVDSGTQITMTGNANATISSFFNFSHANYDVFAYDNAGTITLELLAWTNNTTRATALTVVDGLLVKSGDTTRLYVGTIRLISDANAADSVTQRFCYSAYNRAARALQKTEQSAASSWAYTTTSWRPMNNDYRNRVEILLGLSIDSVQVMNMMGAASSSGATVSVGVGLDSQSSPSGLTPLIGGGGIAYYQSCIGIYNGTPGVGYHYFQALEYGGTNGTFFGTNAPATCGLSGTVFA